MSIFRAHGPLTLIGLILLMVAYVWPVQDNPESGPITITFSQLLGFRFEGQDASVRMMAAAALRPLVLWIAVAVSLFVRTDSRRRAFLLGAIAFFGLTELFVFVQHLVIDQFVGPPTFVGIFGAVILIAGAVSGLARTERP